MHEITLTRAQYEAIARVRESMTAHDRESTQRISLRRNDGLIETDLPLRVVFDAGWGTSTFDIDADGNSEHVPFPNGTTIGEAFESDDLAQRLRSQLAVKEDRTFPFTAADVDTACQNSDILDARLNGLYADWRADRITDAFYTAELLKLGYTKNRDGGRPVLATTSELRA